MEPASIGVRLASSVISPLVRKLFVTEGPGAALVDKPVRISAYVSFSGEKRSLTEKDVTKLAAELVKRALKSGERPLPADEEQAVVHALSRTLHALGDLTMTDVQAVELGHSGLALHLRQAAGNPDRDLAFDSALFYERLLDTACLHILHFFTQRSAFVPRTLVEQTRRQAELLAKMDELIARNPLPGSEDEAFERRYLSYVAAKHSQLTIYGIDLANSPDRWPLDAAYLTLQAQRPTDDQEPEGGYIAAAGSSLPAEEAFADHDLVLLRGVAGSGKTTLVQWLAVTAARGERGDRVPFVLPLRTLVRRADGLPAPADFLAAARVPFHGAAPDGWPDRVLTASRGLLLVDGIDEIPEPDRERTRRWLRDLLDAYPGNQWLVTSRPSAVREDWLAADGFTELALSPMSRTDVAAFIERWHTAARIDAPDPERLTAYETSLLEAVRTKPDLGQLATNPLMCGLICALHRDRRGYLPHGRQELYDAALSMLLARRDQERDMLPESPQDGIRLTELPQIQLLQRLAYWLIRNNRLEMDRERAERIIADALPSLPAVASQGDAPAIYRYLLIRSGLLREPALGTVEFVHRTFQDYLGAKAAVEDGDFGLLVRNAPDSQWSDVIRMAVAHARPRERAVFLEDLLASAHNVGDDTAGTHIRLLALACLEQATELDPKVRGDVEEQAATLIPPRTTKEARELASVGPLVLELLPGPEGLSEEEARTVVVAASLIGTDAAIPVLARFRTHPFLSLRAQLTWNWHRFDTERYATDVIAHLPADDLYFTAHSAAHLRALHELGDPPRLHLVGDIEEAELSTWLAHDQTRMLAIRENHKLGSLDCLSALRRLVHLDISDSPDVESLAPLAEMPLPWLSLALMPGLEKPDALAPLSASATLRKLDIGVPLYGESVDAALPNLPLEFLRFTRNALRFTGLRGLHRMRSVKVLSLGNLSAPLTSKDYEEVAMLPELEELRLNWTAAPWTEGPTLPGIRRLRLNKFTGNEDLSAVPALFPGLHSVEFVLAPEVIEVPEHTLQLFPGMHTVTKSHTAI
ncbi:NACHT domain-containing protein [Streptomyces sp. NPDC048825]|uniref:NACHT domain-containing protein n=1 Tax=Streptomyces sp. NPDC048825 TaxID=3365592 RepID=UPI0037216640